MLRSRLFFDAANLGDHVDPIEFVLGAVRALEMFDPAPSTLVLADWCGRLGQDLFYPPNVGGWPGGRAWITTRRRSAGRTSPRPWSAASGRARARRSTRRPGRAARPGANPLFFADCCWVPRARGPARRGRDRRGRHSSIAGLARGPADLTHFSGGDDHDHPTRFLAAACGIRR